MSEKGECFCGSIKYEVSARLLDPLSCHCSRCRKAFSSQASNYARIEAGSLKWTSGENLLSRYIDKGGFGMLFCSNCGSTLAGIVAGEVHGVALGCLTEEPDIDEVHHIFVGSKAAWEVIPDDVTQFVEARSEEARR